MAEIMRLFAVKGWRLWVVQKQDGTWEARFFPLTVGATTGTVVDGLTRLHAAEIAWARYQHDPWLGGS